MKVRKEVALRVIDWFQRVAVRGLAVSLLTGAAFAEEAKEEAKERAISELTSAYQKLGGFIATYRSDKDGKALEGVLGMDYASGLGAVQVTVTAGDQTMKMRQWYTATDQVFVSVGDEVNVFTGLNEEWTSICELVRGVDGEAGVAGPLLFAPFLLLEKSSFGAGISIMTQGNPAWVSAVKEAPIQSSDEKSVSFLTEKYGLLSISRESGLLTRQSFEGEGKSWVMELKELQLNPGKDGIAAITADWSTDGAKENPLIAWMAPLRMLVFQLIIDYAEKDEAAAARLDSLLEEQYEVLRHFVQACIDEKEGPFASKADWPSLFGTIKDSARKLWLKRVPGADLNDENSFLEFLQQPEIRLGLRNAMVAGILESKKAPEVIMDEIFGRGGWASLKVGNEQGVAAKKAIVDALSRAYLEAIIDRKMVKQWDQRDGLD